MLGLKHSLHRKISEAKAFYAVFAAILVASGVIVLIPGSPLGLLTTGVQVLAGVLLPSATVFLLLLCNDAEVLGPWVNGRAMNIFTSSVIAVLIVLSLVLTASVLFPDLGSFAVLAILVGGSLLFATGGIGFLVYRTVSPASHVRTSVPRSQRGSWRMPPLALLGAPNLTAASRVGLTVMRAYLLIAMILVIVRVVQLALGH